MTATSDRGRPHRHGDADNETRLFQAMVLTGVFMVVEVIGGIYSGSLALLADAGHMLTDTAALPLAWLVFRFGARAPGSDHEDPRQRHPTHQIDDKVDEMSQRTSARLATKYTATAATAAARNVSALPARTSRASVANMTMIGAASAAIAFAA